MAGRSILTRLPANFEYVQAQSLGIKEQLVLSTSLLHGTGNGSCVLDLLQLHVRLALLDGLSDQLGRPSLTLCLDNHGLLLLTCPVHDEGRPLGLLLGDLLRFYGRREFRRE